MIPLEKLSATLQAKPATEKPKASYGAPRTKYGRPQEPSAQVASTVKAIVRETLGGGDGR